mgnify:CR=1 FL=1
MAQKKRNHDIVYGLQKYFKPCTGGTRIFNSYISPLLLNIGESECGLRMRIIALATCSLRLPIF